MREENEIKSYKVNKSAEYAEVRPEHFEVWPQKSIINFSPNRAYVELEVSLEEVAMLIKTCCFQILNFELAGVKIAEYLIHKEFLRRTKCFGIPDCH